MRTAHFLIPTLAVVTALFAGPAVAAESDPPSVDGLAEAVVVGESLDPSDASSPDVDTECAIVLKVSEQLVADTDEAPPVADEASIDSAPAGLDPGPAPAPESPAAGPEDLPALATPAAGEEFAVTFIDEDPATQTATITGTGTSGAFVSVLYPTMGDVGRVETTVAPEGTFSVTLTNVSWGWSEAVLTHTVDGLEESLVIDVYMIYPEIVPITMEATFDQTTGMVTLHGRGSPGAWFETRQGTSLDALNYFDGSMVGQDGTWSIGPFRASEFPGPMYEVVQYTDPIQAATTTIEWPLPTPTPSPVVPIVSAPVAVASVVARPAHRPVEPASLARTGADIGNVGVLAGMFILVGGMALVARRRVSATPSRPLSTPRR